MQSNSQILRIYQIVSKVPCKNPPSNTQKKKNSLTQTNQDSSFPPPSNHNLSQTTQNPKKNKKQHEAKKSEKKTIETMSKTGSVLSQPTSNTIATVHIEAPSASAAKNTDTQQARGTAQARNGGHTYTNKQHNVRTSSHSATLKEKESSRKTTTSDTEKKDTPFLLPFPSTLSSDSSELLTLSSSLSLARDSKEKSKSVSGDKHASEKEREKPAIPGGEALAEQQPAKHKLTHTAFIFQPANKNNSLDSTQIAHTKKAHTRNQEKTTRKMHKV